MNSGKKKVLVALTLVLVISGLYLYLAPRQGWIETDNAYVQGEITPVSAEVAGVVTRVLVTDNQWVEAGTLLAQLDKRNYLALKDKAAGALAEVEASIVSARQQIEMQIIAVKEAETAIDSAATDARYQRVEWQRLSNLLRDNLASKSTHDGQKTRMERAELALTSSKLKLEGSRQGLASARSQLELLQARRIQAESELALAQLNLEDTDIRAPVAGVVGNRAVRQGRLVAAGTPLLSIVPTDEVWVEANFKEGEIARLKPQQRVSIEVDGFPEHDIEGRVMSVAPATGAQFSMMPPDNATGNFVKVVQRVPVKIALSLPQALRGRVVPGLSAVVAVDARHE